MSFAPFTNVSSAHWLAAAHREASRFRDLSDLALRQTSLELGGMLRECQNMRSVIASIAALAQTAAARQLSMPHYDVQLVGGRHLAMGDVVEMRTGEGKTLTAVIPLIAHAMFRKGALLATANDYLAKRDAELNGPIFQSLGFSVGVIQTGMDRRERRQAYACDITYGTMKEFGFDFLRDYLFQRQNQRNSLWLGDSQDAGDQEQAAVQRPPHFLLVDEADSILIDDARTPLILSGLADAETQAQQQNLFRWCATAASEFLEDEHYFYDKEKRRVELTTLGTQLVRSIEKPAALRGSGLLEFYEAMERAIQVSRDYHRDRDYVVRDNEIMIVDEATGRISHGRRWSRGIHQAIEAKESLAVSAETKTQAKITVQAFVNRFPIIAGMTGTAVSAAREFKQVYGVRVQVLDTNRPIRQTVLPMLVARSEEEKWSLIVDEIREVHQQGRPILVGTRSIAKSELLSGLLQEAGIPHAVLNANHIEREAEIVAMAGQQGNVTVATNMAGRGTDIQIDQAVRERGGLHVIGTELHESIRIDRQLFGRCARQGDPGSVRQFIAHTDSLLDAAYGVARANALRKSGKSRTNGWWINLFRKAQRKVENRHYRARKVLMYNEATINRTQREMGFDPVLDHLD